MSFDVESLSDESSVEIDGDNESENDETIENPLVAKDDESYRSMDDDPELEISSNNNETRRKAKNFDREKMPNALSASKLYYPFRTLGVVTDGVPFVLRRVGEECFINTSVGRSFQAYRSDHLRLSMASSPCQSKRIRCMAVKGNDLTFAGCGKDVLYWKRLACYGPIGSPHSGDVISIACIGDVLVSMCDKGMLRTWPANEVTRGELLSPTCDVQLSEGFENPTCFTHPPTYLNKVVIGSEKGKLGLWNIRTGKHLHTFACMKELENLNDSITVLESSPALDVLAVGRRSGAIAMIHLRQDIILFSLSQATAVSCMSFRTDLASAVLPMLVTGTHNGRIHVWDLLKRRLHHTMTCHKGQVSSCAFLTREPILVTSSPSNSLCMWIFDAPDGTARLLRSREGHGAPPRKIQYYGGVTTSVDPDSGYGDALNILSAGSDGAFRRFHTIRDALNLEMSQKQLLKTSLQSMTNRQGKHLMNIIAFDCCETRASDWNNICTCHEEDENVYVWSYKNRCAGKHILRQPHWPGNCMMYPANPKNFSSSVSLSACGNFALVGTRGGIIYKYNIQSGLARGSFPLSATPLPISDNFDGKPLPGSVAKVAASNRKVLNKAGEAMKAEIDLTRASEDAKSVSVCHTEAVQGLAIDAFNATVASGGLDGKLIFWNFASHAPLTVVNVGAAISQLRIVRDAGLLAAACDDCIIRMFDFNTRNLVRRLVGHTGPIVDIAFTFDSRRLASAASDSSVRIWDLPTGKCVDWLKFNKPVTSLTASPTGEFLCTSHQERLGLCVWADRSYFQPVYLDAVPTSPILMDEPPTVAEEGENETGINDEGNYSQDKRALRGACTNEPDAGLEPMHERIITGEGGKPLISLSGLPRAYWTGLFQLELIKARNRPILPPQKPPQAPFFLPSQHTGGSVLPSFETNEDDSATKTDGKSELVDPDPQGWDAVWSEDEKKEEFDGAIDTNENVQGELGTIANSPGTKKRGKKKRKKPDIDGNSSSRIFDSRKRKGGDTSFFQYRCKTAVLIKKGTNSASIMKHLTSLGPSAIDIEFSALCSGLEDVEGIMYITKIAEFLLQELRSRVQFEVVQAYMHRFLKLYSELIMTIPELNLLAGELQKEQMKSMNRLTSLVQENLCLVQFLTNVQI